MLPDVLRNLLAEEGAYAFTAEMLGRVAATLHEFDALASTECVAFFEPPSLEARIVNQFALFSLTSSPLMQLDTWLEQHPQSSAGDSGSRGPEVGDPRQARPGQHHRAGAVSGPRRPVAVVER